VLHSGKRVFLKNNKILPRVLHSRKRIFHKRKVDVTNGVKSSSSARTALGEGFSECAIFGTRGRHLSRERHPRRLFPECCTREGFPECFFIFPECRMHLGKPPSPVVRRVPFCSCVLRITTLEKPMREMSVQAEMDITTSKTRCGCLKAI
jgi:hypothetical protein